MEYIKVGNRYLVKDSNGLYVSEEEVAEKEQKLAKTSKKTSKCKVCEIKGLTDKEVEVNEESVEIENIK